MAKEVRLAHKAYVSRARRQATLKKMLAHALKTHAEREGRAKSSGWEFASDLMNAEGYIAAVIDLLNGDGGGKALEQLNEETPHRSCAT